MGHCQLLGDSVVNERSLDRMTFIIPCLLLVVTLHAGAADCSLKGGIGLPEAKQKKVQELRTDTADQAAIRFDMAIDYAKAGNTEKALDLLRDALKDTPWLDPSAEPAFKPLFGCSDFEHMVTQVHRKYPRVAASRVVFTIPQKDLIPEGLACDPTDGTLYMSSIIHRKILKITPNGKISNFVAEAQDGLLGVLGVRIDPNDRSVWAVSELRGQSALFHFDRNGKTLGHYPPQEPGSHEFNDLVVTSKGDVLVTDDLDNAVYKLSNGTNTLARLDLRNRSYPNGIALAADGSSVYVAYAYGIAVMAVDGSSVVEVRAPKDISLAQVDGFYFKTGGLNAIQNVFGGNRIVQLTLAADGRSVTSGRLFEFRSANIDLPTTGAIYKDRFYYIVNSQIDHERDGNLLNMDKLQPIRIAILGID